jgi:hypothetical protein
VFLGPLSDSANLISRTGGDVRPSLFVRDGLARSAQRLRDRTGPAIWSTFSTVDRVGTPVAGGWIDDAYDTQRRRGTKALQRNIY